MESIVNNYEDRQQEQDAEEKKKWWQRRSKAETKERKEIDKEFKRKEQEARLEAYRNEREQKVRDVKSGKPTGAKAKLYKYAENAKNNLAKSGAAMMTGQPARRTSARPARRMQPTNNLGLSSGQGFKSMLGSNNNGSGFARMVGYKTATPKKSNKKRGTTIIIK